MDQKLIKKIEDKSAVIGIVGLGYVGLPLALRFSETGFKVIGFDIDPTKIKILEAGQSYIKHIPSERINRAVTEKNLAVTTDFGQAKKAEALIICVPTPLNKHREPDLSFVMKTIKSLAPHLREGQVVSLEITTYPGTTHEEIKPIIERSGLFVGKDIFLKEIHMNNIFPSPSSVPTTDRHILNGHRGGLIWFTGLSGSGKSTLAHAVEKKLHSLCVRSYVLDGDNIRTGLNQDLGLSAEDRKENTRRIAEVAKIMVNAGLLVFAAFITPYKQSREYVRDLMIDWPYYEVYIKCNIDVCAKRDPKGLYKKVSEGEITDMTGISAPYEEPEAPSLIIETGKLGLHQCVDEVINFLLKQKLISAASQFELTDI